MNETYDDRYSKAESATRFIKQRVDDVTPSLENDDDSPERRSYTIKPALWTSIIAGGIAGVAVDFTLYPLDTIKTRLQSKEGFHSSGGFKKLYKGIIPVMLTSAPLSALFFGTYNTVINSLRTSNSSLNPLVYLVAASAAELFCSAFRVPLEIVKQRKQISNTNSIYIIKKTYEKEGFHGFYRGFWTLILREIPFAAIQYPVWEYMIDQFIIYQRGQSLTALQTAYCGAAAGAIAAILTTPVDVVKTRIMLAEKEKIEQFKPYVNFNFAKEVFYDRGLSGFFAGVIPRTLWIMLGGFIYFGAYEKVKILSEQKWCMKSNLEKPHVESPSYFEEKVGSFAFLTEFICSQQKKKEDNSINQATKAGIEKPKATFFSSEKIVDSSHTKPADSSVDEK